MAGIDDKMRLLIVDDDEMNRVILHTLFESEYDIVEATDGSQAIRILEADCTQFAAILLDIFMPVIDGFGVLAYLQKTHMEHPIPVFLITADNSDEIICRGFDMGALDVILKPFFPSVIKRRIRTALELYERRYAMEKTISRQFATLQEYSQKLHENDMRMVDALSTIIEFRSLESGTHVRRIREISHLLCTEYMHTHPEAGITNEICDTVSIASAMHDIGKISIPDHILNKPGRLSQDELVVMRQHCKKGLELLQLINKMAPLENAQYYYDICYCHHERWDGKGYPRGLAGDAIPFSAQIVSVADVYDALTNTRIYKPAYTHDEAVRLIRDGECGQFNPKLLECFLRCNEAFRKINVSE